MRNKPEPNPDTQRKALEAATILDSPTFKKAVEAVRGAYLEAMINTAPEEADKREHLHRCIHSLTDVQTALTAFVQSGKIEKSMLVKQEKAKK